jgi:hypothetical protein
MDPWSAVAAASATTSLASRLMASTTRSLRPAAAGFQQWLEGTEPSAVDSKAGSEGAEQPNAPFAEQVEKLKQRIQERIAHLLAEASLGGEPVAQVELSPLGNIYVESDSLLAAASERVLDDDPSLRELLGEWARLTGTRSFDVGNVGANPLY